VEHFEELFLGLETRSSETFGCRNRVLQLAQVSSESLDKYFEVCLNSMPSNPYHGPAHVLDVLQCLVPNGCRWTWLFLKVALLIFLEPETTT